MSSEENNAVKNLRTLFAAPKGIAIFVASLILLSLSILSLSTMNRVSESSFLAGQAIDKKRLSIHAESAMRIALAEVNTRVFNDIPPSDTYYLNGGATDTFLIVYDKENASTPVPLFAYRARAVKLAQGPDKTPPGATGTLMTHAYCYDVLVDTRELIKASGTNINSEMGSPLAGYYFSEVKSLGVTSCFRKR